MSNDNELKEEQLKKVNGGVIIVTVDPTEDILEQDKDKETNPRITVVNSNAK